LIYYYVFLGYCLVYCLVCGLDNFVLLELSYFCGDILLIGYDNKN